MEISFYFVCNFWILRDFAVFSFRLSIGDSYTLAHARKRFSNGMLLLLLVSYIRCEQKNGKKGKQQISETLLCLCAMKIPFGYFLDFGFPAGSVDVRNCGRSECAMERHHIQLYRSQSILLIGSIARSCFSCLNFFRSIHILLSVFSILSSVRWVVV